MIKHFFEGKKVMVTGHTGFKGSWLCKVLQFLKADIVGFSLSPPTNPSLFDLLNLKDEIDDYRGDVRDYEYLKEIVNETRPEVIIHMAAQPLVGVGYSNPYETYQTNVMGTVNILEAIRMTDSVKSFVNVTTDKVYYNNEWSWGYRECDTLNGYDPYSNSKSCSELVTQCYSRCFFNDLAISTARAGNVIGGGDFTNPRIIPDCMRSVLSNTPIILRNPKSTRPYQHVLEPLFAYLMIAAWQYGDRKYAGCYNVGPNDESCVDNETLVKLFYEKWGVGPGYVVEHDPNAPHEANFLKLDISKIKQTFEWKPVWTIESAVEKTVEWIKAYSKDQDVGAVMAKQISEYLENIKW